METQPPSGPPPIGDEVLDAASDVISRHGVAGLTAERLADAMGCSRMTLHRRAITPAAALDALRLRAVTQLQMALAPVLADPGTALDRLRLAIDATLDVADIHLGVLAGMFTDDDAVFHDAADLDEPLPTADAFVAPFRRILLDGAIDGTLRAVDDPTEVATVVFNAIGWTYIQLRWTQRWPADRARSGISALILEGLIPPLPSEAPTQDQA